MKCRNPYIKGMHAYPCGQCMPCRLNRRRMWTHRIMLESLLSADNAFVTLTYSNENLPDGGTLIPKHLQDWFKRLRTAIAPLRVRYYAVGEYGDSEGERPHYHVALFGYPNCRYGQSQYKYNSDGSVQRFCCSICEQIRTTWGNGGVFLGSLETHSAQYIAGYVTKKMTKADDERLNGRHPEFSRMSRRPGIGVDAMWDVASALMQFNLEDTQADVPSALRHGSRLFPLGRLLKGKLREMVGKDSKAPQEVIDALAEEMRPMYEAAIAATPGGGEARKIVFRNMLFDAGEQQVLNMETRLKIRKRVKLL